MNLPSLRELAKQAAFLGLGSSVLLNRRLDRIRASGALTILNLHRVASDDRSTYPPLNPQLFEYLLTFVKQHFTPVTFATAAEETTGILPPLILSFDDAYHDFFTVAVPLLDKHGISVNQNVIPTCIESGLPPLNVMLQDFIGRAPVAIVLQLEVPGFQMNMSTSRHMLGFHLSNFLKNKTIAEQTSLKEMLLPQLACYPEFAATPMMTREEVRQTGAVHELGAHSYEHASMACETGDYLKADVNRCRDYFRDVLGLPLSIYALPNGSYRRDQLDLLETAGLEQILLVDEDFSRRDATFHRRFTFDARSRPEVRFRATGAFRAPLGRPG